MKRILLFFICYFSLFSLLATTIARYNGSRIFWDSRTPVTIFSSGGYARLIELKDGRLLACCESGGIKVCLSSDKGKTWSSPTLIAPNANNTPNCVPDLVQLSDGTIIVGYNPIQKTADLASECVGVPITASPGVKKSLSMMLTIPSRTAAGNLLSSNCQAENSSFILLTRAHT